MRHRAFTLIEMLMVIVIIGLLLMLMIPGLQAAYVAAETSQCASNLHHLYTAIRVERGQRQDTKEFPLPTVAEWPDAALAALETAEVVRCPVDQRKESSEGAQQGRDNPKDVLYQSAMGNHFIPFVPGYSCVSRRGADETGRGYTEYAIEENPYYKATWSGSIYGYSENDGVWRLYDARNGRRTLRLMSYTCGFTTNNLWYQGEMLWTNLQGHIGDDITVTSSFTSYGINKNLSQQSPVSPGAILLLDFRDSVADPMAADFQRQLDDPDSARHGGQHNVLFVDGSVELMGSASLYPQLFPSLWRP